MENEKENQAAAKPIKNEPNIIFIGRKMDVKTEKMIDAEPPTAIHTVGMNIKLPSAAEQRKGFYHEDANRIIREMPDLYKPLIPKGAK